MKNLLFSTLILFLIFSLAGCVPLEQTGRTGGSYGSGSQQLVLADRTYSDAIKTVQFYPDMQHEQASMAPAIITVNQEIPLLLTFDDLRQDYEQYQARLVYCDWNWQESRLSSLQYLFDYNEFPITNYQFSQHSRIPYVHYKFRIPRVKLPGNYVVVVYRNNNPNDIVLSRRFIVYNNQARINATTQLPAGSIERRENQQINFTLHFNNVPNVLDPVNQFKIVIRQNQRWENAITNLKPTSVRAGLHEMEFKNFDGSNQFKGGNEFRFFDLRMVRARGQNVGRVMLDSTGFQAFLVPNRSRAGMAYAQTRDFNGQFIVANAEFPEPSISSEYVDVHFFLESATRRPEPVYVAGAFSNYLPVEPYLMRYDAQAGGYLADILLKQGWYDYLFLQRSETNPLALEGSHAETENQYEIIVYYRPVGEIHDVAIGYSTFNSQR